VLKKVEAGGELLGEVIEIYLHVQSNNDTALDFYKSFGFETKELIKGYYKRIEPPDCYILSKTISRAPSGSLPAAK
jgi:ribosomal protein S18 acetylase RimI-like enzyme